MVYFLLLLFIAIIYFFLPFDPSSSLGQARLRVTLLGWELRTLYP